MRYRARGWLAAGIVGYFGACMPLADLDSASEEWGVSTATTGGAPSGGNAGGETGGASGGEPTTGAQPATGGRDTGGGAGAEDGGGNGGRSGEGGIGPSTGGVPPIECEPPQADCDDDHTDCETTTTDNDDHCGACGHSCTALSETCVGTTCECTWDTARVLEYNTDESDVPANGCVVINERIGATTHFQTSIPIEFHYVDKCDHEGQEETSVGYYPFEFPSCRILIDLQGSSPQLIVAKWWTQG